MAQITAELTSGLQVTISNGRHTWRADEPTEAGGDDAGPTPYEMLIGALAGCTLVTLALYCRHKQIPLKSVSATYEHGRVHADDCEDCGDDKQGYLDRVTSRVRIAGSFDDAQRTRLEQIVSRCPVHKTLENGVVMVDRVTFAE
ncbi:MAG: OsmC family protein [Gemmatimonadota bacterium]|jgi:putative redox protein|nr:OsmC family protein [Gemmatimonadota bacterium]MDH3368881.1 OsmC family protein [Gemmatimonadota bacterium]MDH3477314.1 OsmC family protein [Gemmatimonadota bacterium]MDH3571315.1 OsmC family protein [Gemmatimonadota bacterium]MDH5550464.1 OsmC family protein [Gemmatimonadota bacterium]